MAGLRYRAGGLLAGVLVLASGGCGGGPTSDLHVRLDAGPAAAAFDAPVHVTMSGLPPGLVTVQASARDSHGQLWQSAAQFRASSAGTLNLATAVPVSGSYRVADAGGLLWSLHPAFTSNPQAQFFMGASGFTVRLQVLADGQAQASAALDRRWQFNTRPTVQTVSRTGFASTLFTPDTIRPGVPAVVVIGGSGGGEATLTAAALALAGYPALALGYFKEDGLPSCLCDIPLEYFARAVGWLRAQPAARDRPVALYGASRGAEAALLIASYEPQLFEAVVASSPSYLINGAFGGSGPAWTFQGRALPTGTSIPVGRIRVPLLLSDGGLDAVWDSARSATTITAELQAAHDPAPYINLYYARAGHAFLGDPPYFPFSGYGTNGYAMGGTKQANAQAAEQSWAKMLSFLNDPSGRVR